MAHSYKKKLHSWDVSLNPWIFVCIKTNCIPQPTSSHSRGDYSLSVRKFEAGRLESLPSHFRTQSPDIHITLDDFQCSLLHFPQPLTRSCSKKDNVKLHHLSPAKTFLCPVDNCGYCFTSFEHATPQDHRAQLVRLGTKQKGTKTQTALASGLYSVLLHCLCDCGTSIRPARSQRS